MKYPLITIVSRLAAVAGLAGTLTWATTATHAASKASWSALHYEWGGRPSGSSCTSLHAIDVTREGAYTYQACAAEGPGISTPAEGKLTASERKQLDQRASAIQSDSLASPVCRHAKEAMPASLEIVFVQLLDGMRGRNIKRHQILKVENGTACAAGNQARTEAVAAELRKIAARHARPAPSATASPGPSDGASPEPVVSASASASAAPNAAPSASPSPSAAPIKAHSAPKVGKPAAPIPAKTSK